MLLMVPTMTFCHAILLFKTYLVWSNTLAMFILNCYKASAMMMLIVILMFIAYSGQFCRIALQATLARALFPTQAWELEKVVGEY